MGFVILIVMFCAGWVAYPHTYDPWYTQAVFAAGFATVINMAFGWLMVGIIWIAALFRRG